MSPKRKAPPVPLFDQIVFAPDRERVPGARHVVSWDEGDDADYLAAIEAVATRKVELRRRGQEHGAWAELDLSASGVDPRREPLSPEDARERWETDRPILLPGILTDLAEACADEGVALGERLREPAGLGAWLAESKAKLPEGLELADQDMQDTDERTLAKRALTRGDGPDLWLKSARLSTFDGDASLRLRASFGEEVDDDASADEAAHRAVARVAEALLPGALRVGLEPTLGARLRELLGADPLFTQQIAYWNAPQGGALMHHDAFDAPDNGGQVGVCYAQLAGATAWLALSLGDLADRVTDYCEALEEGEADWVRKALWPDRHDFERSLARIKNRAAFELELSEPGQGRFGALVGRAEFTSFLTDCGHGVLVGPGDVLLLPSHGLTRCALHSVFCAGDEPTYSISSALRAPDAASGASRQ